MLAASAIYTRERGVRPIRGVPNDLDFFADEPAGVLEPPRAEDVVIDHRDLDLAARRGSQALSSVRPRTGAAPPQLVAVRDRRYTEDFVLEGARDGVDVVRARVPRIILNDAKAARAQVGGMECA